MHAYGCGVLVGDGEDGGGVLTVNEFDAEDFGGGEGGAYFDVEGRGGGFMGRGIVVGDWLLMC